MTRSKPRVTVHQIRIPTPDGERAFPLAGHAFPAVCSSIMLTCGTKTVERLEFLLSTGKQDPIYTGR